MMMKKKKKKKEMKEVLKGGGSGVFTRYRFSRGSSKSFETGTAIRNFTERDPHA